MKVELFQSRQPCELVSFLDADFYGAGTGILPPEVRIGHVFLPGCERGDILDIEAMFQVTNDLGYNVEFTSKLVLTQSATGISGQPITNPRYGLGENVTPAMHHMVRNMTDRVLIEKSGDYYVAAIGYAGSDGEGPNDKIKLDRGGHMSVLRFRE
ncbi:hypothetical protein [Mesorhizobium sp. Pch-S]|uniref:hypothetical protein n=1 Tax=Mesorhizobium sp. Pch-S TaxID=2082387 RepID=UPI0010109D64|nr:hypothetical protein [Mesorhizobium sp. Pch-S]QAZ46753.1 hypothetical protein C1M53_31360 [Mesorhizobium sp. Pch-S]